MHTLAPVSADHGSFRLPAFANERVRDYAPGSIERTALKSQLSSMLAGQIELPLVIGGEEVLTGSLEDAVVPHNHRHVLARAHLAGGGEITRAITAALDARQHWSGLSWQERAAIFLKAADLAAGPWRDRLNAATMLGQSKTVHQAEIDAAAELVDFWRFNVQFMCQIYADQPQSSPGTWNRVDYRPLEGFVYTVTPFNFTAIAGNLPSAPALMGNTVVWKPSATAMFAAHYIMAVLREAGLPPGVINLVYGDAAEVTNAAISSPMFAGLHFTGSTAVFDGLLRKVADRTGSYRSYPRIVGETGGKNFVVAHASADTDALATAIIRGGYEYQGQKCSAASRIFVPDTLWPKLKTRLSDEIATIKIGDVTDFGNFMGAVIDLKSWNRLTDAQEEARTSDTAKIIAGGSSVRETGYFVQPTLLEVSDVKSRFLTEELFGPIVSVYVYPERGFPDVLELIDQASRYGLTGSIFSRDRSAVEQASARLRNAAGNFYINDKPTGAVVGQQSFGGARASGTNDKAGSMWNLMRWVSPRTIKETFVPPANYRYPFLAHD